LGHEFVTRFGPRFRYLYIANGGPSPAQALNEGSRLARAPLLGLMIDGARVLTPGVLRLALLAASACKHVLVATLGWHLGPGLQQISTNRGYDAAAEDRLLESIGWPIDGYRLFEIATLAGSSLNGWF